MLKVLGKISSINVRKVLWVCAELNLPFEREDWGSGFRPTDTPEYLALNPNALVPVIKDGDFVMWESNPIICYLASRYGGEAIYPAAPQVRAIIEQWMGWQATELNRAWTHAFLGLVRKSPAHQAPEEIKASIAGWTRQMRILDDRLTATGAFVAGGDFTLADIPIGLSAHRWMQTPFERAALPAVSAYLARLAARPGFATYCTGSLP